MRLSEQGRIGDGLCTCHCRFNPPGGFEAFGTAWCCSFCAPERGSFNPPGGFEAFGTPPRCARRRRAYSEVSIRRADLRLSERLGEILPLPTYSGFNPPGGFEAFGTGRR
ncbi:hypothetical protein OSCT_0298 [Oscillochloris trichoides DG-6]|uniref:Uncharacterized protein n=1 Tax=Oscillochloris trichoides DG-6 TaxID=765420 RepID=E1IAE7_9CHLR|nr:hypothetical protein OSCT_0298 [Oscillochloris trichoides DG-6]